MGDLASSSSFFQSMGDSESMLCVQSTREKANLRTSESQVSAEKEWGILPLLTSSSTFIQDHLSPKHIPDYPWLYDAVQASIRTLGRIAIEKDAYEPIVVLLNRLSIEAYKLIHDGKPSLKLEDGCPKQTTEFALRFVASPSKSPPSDVFVCRVKPDILCYQDSFSHLLECLSRPAIPDPCSNRIQLPTWTQLETVLEYKVSRESEAQIIHYSDTLLRYRPDKNRILTLTGRHNSFCFFSADALGPVCSDVFKWQDNIALLFRFIYTLYDDNHRDYSLSLANSATPTEYPRWSVTFEEKTYHLRPVFARKGEGRRTWLAVGDEMQVNTASSFRVVKDMWRDERRRFEEEAILNKIHRHGFVQGVVRVAASGPLLDVYIERNVGGQSRRILKRRLIMGSTGDRLSACENVLQFLKVMYDTLEVYQDICELGVLHRDLSWFNILCNPQHFVSGQEYISPGRKYIGDILGERDANPCCLLTDFDNASENDNPRSPELTHRTGTPMFIAVDISGGILAYKRLVRHLKFTLDPQAFCLQGESYECYIRNYGKNHYDRFNDFLQDLIGDKLEKQDIFANGQGIYHHPVHDAESVFWIIIWFFIRVLPDSDTEDKLGPKYLSRAKTVLGHNIADEDDGTAGRTDVFFMIEEDWQSVLHPDCHGLISMLLNMQSYMAIRWLQFPDISRYHAHEALKRLLLKEIVRMKNENKPIPIKGPRRLPLKMKANYTGTVNTGSNSYAMLVPSVTSGSSMKRPVDKVEGAASTKEQMSKRRKKHPADDEKIKKDWLFMFQQDALWFKTDQ